MADAGEAPARARGLRPHRARRLLRREGLLREPPGLLRHRQPVPPVGKPGPFPGVLSPHGHWAYGRLENGADGSIPARCISLARQGYVVFSWDMVGYNDSRQVDHRLLDERLAQWGIGSSRPAPLEQHPFRGLPRVAPRRRPGPPLLHRRLGRGNADVPAHGGGRPHPGLRPREHDLALHAGRRRVRERAPPPPRHEQRGDRGAHGPAADAHGLGGRRLDARHAAHRVPRGPGRLLAPGGEGRGGDRPVHRRPQLQPRQPRGGVRLVRPVGAREDRRRALQGGGVPGRAALGPPGLLRAGAAEGGEDAGADRRGPDRGPQGPARGTAARATRPARSLSRRPRPRASPRRGGRVSRPATCWKRRSSGPEGRPARSRRRASRPGRPRSGPALGAAEGSREGHADRAPRRRRGVSAREASLVEPLRRAGHLVAAIDAFNTGRARRPARHERPLLHDLQPHGRLQPRAGHPHRARLAEAADRRPRGVPRRPGAGRAVVPPGRRGSRPASTPSSPTPTARDGARRGVSRPSRDPAASAAWAVSRRP